LYLNKNLRLSAEVVLDSIALTADYTISYTEIYSIISVLNWHYKIATRTFKQYGCVNQLQVCLDRKWSPKIV